MRRLIGFGMAALGALVLLYGLLAIDLAWRIWVMRRGFDSGIDVGLLILLEAVRAIVSFGLVGVAAGAIRRRQPGHTALAASLLFLGAVYANASSFVVFPGYLQERLAMFLLDAGMPRPVLRTLFGSALWAVPPALACFLAFATRYPVQPDAESLRRVHATGRRGMLRDVALAGADIRSLVHHGAARALEAGLLGPAPLVVWASAGAALALSGAGAATVVVLVVSGAAFACALACLRTAYLAGPAEHRPRLRRLALAGISIGVQFVAGGALSFLPGSAAALLALMLASAAPLVALGFVAAFTGPHISHEELARGTA